MTSSRFVRWWKNNPDKAEAIRQRRRKRYANDEEFAQKERARKRKSRTKKREFGRTYPKPKLYPIDGKLYELWSVGRVAETLGIHKRTLAGLEARGAIPTNRYVDVNGRRWWPKAYVEWLKPYFDLKNNREISSQEFSSRVWNDWNLTKARGTLPVIGESDDRDRHQHRTDDLLGSDDPESNQDS